MAFSTRYDDWIQTDLLKTHQGHEYAEGCFRGVSLTIASSHVQSDIKSRELTNEMNVAIPSIRSKSGQCQQFLMVLNSIKNAIQASIPRRSVRASQLVNHASAPTSRNSLPICVNLYAGLQSAVEP